MMNRIMGQWTGRCLLGLAGGALSLSVWAGPADDAAQAYNAGNYADAVSLYERALAQDPALRGDAALLKRLNQAEARVAYDQGSKLHAQGEYNAAADAFLRAIAKDADYDTAYAALQDAQRAGVRQHLLAALEAADKGDLLKAKQRLESSLVLGGAGDERVLAALSSITQPGESPYEQTLKQLEAARKLMGERVWDQADTALRELIEQAPYFLPARADLTRTQRAMAMSEQLTNQAAELAEQDRLSHAAPKLASALTVWPGNASANELQASVQAGINRTAVLTTQAEEQLKLKETSEAYKTINEALAIDAANTEARKLSRTISDYVVGEMMTTASRLMNTEGNYKQARRVMDEAQGIRPNHAAIRRQMAHYHYMLAQMSYTRDREGTAVLHYMLGKPYGVNPDYIDRYQRQVVKQADTSFALGFTAFEPDHGVSSSDLAGYLSAANLSGRGALVQAEQATDARYQVRVQLFASDIALRQRRDGLIPLAGISLNQRLVTYQGNHYWEKYGSVDAQVTVIDTQAEQTVDSWNSSRWVNYTDRQQFFVGNTWQDSYWTLPSDDVVRARLARELASQLGEEITERVTLVRARALRDEADALAEEDPVTARDLRARAVIVAGQVNPKEARRELRRMAKALDESLQAKTAAE